MKDGIGTKFIDRCHRVLYRQLTDVHQVVNNYTSSEVAEVSAWISAQPHRQREPLRWLQAMSIQICTAVASNAIDNTFALIDLLDQPENKLHEWAYLTLARAVVESATVFSHLSDRTIPPERRLLHAAALIVRGRLDEQKLARELGGDIEQKQIEIELGKLMRRLDKAHIIVRRSGRNDIVGLDRGTERVSLNVNVTEESGRRFSRAAAPYRIGSAVTHSAWWFLASSMTLEGNQMVVDMGINNLVSAVVITLDALDVMAVACAGDEQSSQAGTLSAATDRRVKIVLASRQLA